MKNVKKSKLDNIFLLQKVAWNDTVCLISRVFCSRNWCWCYSIRASWQSRTGEEESRNHLGHTRSSHALTISSFNINLIHYYQSTSLLICWTLLSLAVPVVKPIYSAHSQHFQDVLHRVCLTHTVNKKTQWSWFGFTQDSQTINTQELICYAVPQEKALEITTFLWSFVNKSIKTEIPAVTSLFIPLKCLDNQDSCKIT